MPDPSPQEVVDAVSEVVDRFDELTATPEGQAAVEAAVAYGATENHEE